jgi:hypothetical protein
VIAGEHAETAGIRMDFHPERELHREVRDIGVWQECAKFVHDASR